eukprot:CAMPEP_0197441010 /NCGR_PEP_ID=MMETSP1175-20131217/7381_1 /TAXON_ID=1003142 /ORGANISM="Triceratium dubium, Strain CCMP147" /LENGTH=468 /DNA_ID=CAMNT_0042971223 /DNA_START=227 /DNA_END=1633 /DNA_ORIENTATION=-
MSTVARTVAVYVPLLSGSLSMMGSGSILCSIYHGRKTKLRDPQHRILGMMSIFDMFYSLCKALTFVLYPAGFGVPTFGNATTCTIQGFFTQFGYGAGTYNLVLSLYYYLTINRGMKQRDFARRLEKVLHFFVVSLHISFAIAGASIGLFNKTPAFCYIAPAPYGCTKNPDVPCTLHGTTFPYFYEAFAQIWIQLAYVVIFLTNMAIWMYVRRQEKAMQVYSMSRRNMTLSTDAKFGKMKKKSKHARDVFIQSMLYVGAFVLSWSWATVFHLVGWIGGYQAFWPVLLINAFLPLQGFWNAFIYARPRYLRVRRKSDSRLTFLQVLKLVFLPPKPTGPTTTLLSQGGTLHTQNGTSHHPCGTLHYEGGAASTAVTKHSPLSPAVDVSGHPAASSEAASSVSEEVEEEEKVMEEEEKVMEMEEKVMEMEEKHPDDKAKADEESGRKHNDDGSNGSWEDPSVDLSVDSFDDN